MNNTNEIVVFWGTGNVGMRLTRLFELHGFRPDYYCDNDTKKQGMCIDGIEVISPDRINGLKNVTLVAAIYYSDEVRKNISENGILVDRFIDGSNYSSYEFLNYIYEKKGMVKGGMANNRFNKAVMDFNYGTSLGGVQTWCYSQISVIDKLGIGCGILMPDNQRTLCDYPDRVNVAKSNRYSEYDMFVDSYFELIKELDVKWIIINFPREILTAAILVKKFYRNDIIIIAVIHSDDEIYYATYEYFKKYINKWCVISDVMEEKVRRIGVKPETVHRIDWKVQTRRKKISPRKLRIGFAGRIVIEAKRIDKVLDVAEALTKKGISVSFQIAGSGDSEDYLRDRLSDNEMLTHVEYLGCIPHDRILDFWCDQDIFLSCSDFEGHSISQYEAMAVGAVPVVTDTSGVRDDIVDGKNGFILPIGDVEGIVDKIVFLNENRDVLQRMSDACTELIEDRNKNVDEAAMWKEILDIDK